ncbi:MAG: hypothetical protein AAF703_03385 [Cyanobacteria bacterium P01_D01_bin.105]
MTLLEALQNQLSDLEGSGLDETAIDRATATAQSAARPDIRDRLLQCQPMFQQVMSCLAEVRLTPAVEQRLRPAQTEAHRLIRLMGVDAMRFQTAKQPESFEKVRAQLLSKTERLQGFVQVLAKAISETST